MEWQLDIVLLRRKCVIDLVNELPDFIGDDLKPILSILKTNNDYRYCLIFFILPLI